MDSFETRYVDTKTPPISGRPSKSLGSYEEPQQCCHRDLQDGYKEVRSNHIQISTSPKVCLCSPVPASNIHGQGGGGWHFSKRWHEVRSSIFFGFPFFLQKHRHRLTQAGKEGLTLELCAGIIDKNLSLTDIAKEEVRNCKTNI